MKLSAIILNSSRRLRQWRCEAAEKQGCRKLFRAEGANRAKGASIAPEASRGLAGSGGESCKKGILPCSVIIILCQY